MKLAERYARFFILMTAAVFTAFTVGGCGGGGGSSSGSPSDGGGGPNIALSTNQLLFGNVVANAAGLRSADRSMQVTNTGTANLVIGQIAQTDSLAAPFSIFDDNCSGITLAPNASCIAVVRFKPLVPGSYGPDTFDIPSNDPNQRSLKVSVSGDGKGLNVTINKVDTSGVSGKGGPVKMLVSVTDGDNNPVKGLPKDAFAVSEIVAGKAAPKAITIFNDTVTTAVSAALDLDYSGSITPVQKDVEESAKQFLDQLNPLTDEAAVIKFARVVQTAKDFTPLTPADNLKALKDAIDAPYTDLTDGTKLYDAVFDSVEKLSLRVNDRRAVIVVSDGFDLLSKVPASTHDLDDVIADANDKKVFIFSIGLVGESGINTEVMQRMAVETGGQYFEAPNSTDLKAMYDQISLILTNQYEITFMTTRPAGSSNSLNVVVTNMALDGEDTKSVIY